MIKKDFVKCVSLSIEEDLIRRQFVAICSEESMQLAYVVELFIQFVRNGVVL